MIDQTDFEPLRKPKSKLNCLPSNPEACCEDKSENRVVGPGRFPSWLHRKLPTGAELWKTGAILEKKRLHTVCEEAKCPNLLECWSRKTATFLAMGKQCTRSCGFCSIDFSAAPMELDQEEPRRIAESIQLLGLKHVVITMVARDDLEDGGANHLAAIIKEVREQNSEVTIEVLTSDFSGNVEALNTVLEAKPEIFNYNLETVRELTPRVRHKATYERTLKILSHAKNFGTSLIKSGMMVGLGEVKEQVFEALKDLKEAGCDIVTIGQYLQSDQRKLRVKSFIHPDDFAAYESYGKNLGIKHMYCGPFIRSSYNADLVLKQVKFKEIAD